MTDWFALEIGPGTQPMSKEYFIIAMDRDRQITEKQKIVLSEAAGKDNIDFVVSSACRLLQRRLDK